MNKVDKRRNYYLVVDTETANSVEQPLPYDIGWAICDKQGRIYERRSFVVAEVFCDMVETMKSAYYSAKIPQYWNDLKAGTRKLKGMWDIRKTMIADMKIYNVKAVCAYNMGFDKRALNNLMRYVSKSWKRWWFPFGTEFLCIWNYACNTILNKATYIDFAIRNSDKMVSKSGNIITSAEAAYRYLIDDISFVEQHTGLEDVEIEVQILANCLKQNVKFEAPINSACWRVLQRKSKELELKAAFAA
jgi:hypothetical protein